MELLPSVFDGESLFAPHRRNYRQCHKAYIGLNGTLFASHDAFVPIDGAWRMLWGQRPHADFYTPFGVGSYLPTLLGFLLSGGLVEGFGYGQAVVGLFIGIWAWLLAKTRLTFVAAAAFVLVVTLNAVGTTGIGLSPLVTTPGMTYNRECYSLLSIFLLEAVLPLRVPTKWAEQIGGFSSGFVLALLLFTKVSFFLVAACMLLALLPAKEQKWRRFAGLIAGALSCMIPICSYFSFNLSPMLGDFAIAAVAKHITLRWYYLDNILTGAAICWAFGTSAGLYCVGCKARTSRTLYIVAPIISIGGVMLILTNYEQAGFPLTAILAVIVVHFLFEKTESRAEGFRISLVLLSAVFIVCSIASNVTGLAVGSYYAYQVRSRAPLRFDSSRLRGFVPIKGEVGYVRSVNDGILLLKKHLVRHDTVLSLDFSNPFAYALGLEPMHGGTNNQQFNTTFDIQHNPSPDWIFGSATLVMLPKQFTDDSLVASVPEVYGPYLKSHYRQVDESPQWSLYRRCSDLNAFDCAPSDELH